MALTQRVVARLAPSPTGAQHLGNARTFLLAWLSARKQNGTVLLRIEDIDSPRIKPWAQQQAIDDLRWLGLDWDQGPDAPHPGPPLVQTQRLTDYQLALKQLQQAQAVYPCSCSRTDVAQAASAPHWQHEGPIYPGTCSQLSASDPNIDRDQVSWRFRALPGTWSFNDRLLGPQSCNVKQELGDFVVARKQELPAYQLAVVVDDHDMNVTEVVRGDDLLASTFRQLQLYQTWNWAHPQFVHVPLVVGPDGRRLAKRHGDTRLATYREAGVRSERIIGLLAWSLGLVPELCETPAQSLVADFAWERITRLEPLVLTNELDSWLRK